MAERFILHGGYGMADTTQPTVGIADAAKQLGISVEAVRQRIRRKRLQAYKDPTGVWRIVLPADESAPSDVQHNVGPAVGSAGSQNGHDRLIDHLQGEVAFLRDEMARQREQWAEESRRKDVIIHELSTQLRALPEKIVEHQQAAAAEPESEDDATTDRTNGSPARPWWRVWVSD
jgi:hypothetical protein